MNTIYNIFYNVLNRKPDAFELLKLHTMNRDSILEYIKKNMNREIDTLIKKEYNNILDREPNNDEIQYCKLELLNGKIKYDELYKIICNGEYIRIIKKIIYNKYFILHNKNPTEKDILHVILELKNNNIVYRDDIQKYIYYYLEKKNKI
jgi:hypothetical protein